MGTALHDRYFHYLFITVSLPCETNKVVEVASTKSKQVVPVFSSSITFKTARLHTRLADPYR
jgi:hypothetical protein